MSRTPAATLLAMLIITLAPARAHSQMEVVPGSAERGRAVFSSKGCIGCHAVEPLTGGPAPDLTAVSPRLESPARMASAIWNSAPAMWSAIQQAGGVIPRFDTRESADLFSYLYSTLYFDALGDAGRGKELFGGKSCGSCHRTPDSSFAGTVGPGVADWSRVQNPIGLAANMWNHAPAMLEAIEQASMRWPGLTASELTDILAYTRSVRTGSGDTEFEPGEPELGLAVFASQCEGCHSFGPSLPGTIDLAERPGPRTLTGYVAAMWNHAPLMQSRSENTLPLLEEGSMDDLVAYLFSQRYFSAPGDPEIGARVYRENRCAACHDQQPSEIGAPDLTQSPTRYSSITMNEALWRHGPDMLGVLEQLGVGWPRFEGDEMVDLMAYLNSRLPSLIAEESEAEPQ